MSVQPSKFDQWAILEIMGHHRFAGRVSEQTVGGAAFVRIDVPEIGSRPAFTKLFGASSIYCISPVSEDVARMVAEQLGVQPISIYDLPDAVRERLKMPALGHVPDREGDYD